MLLLLLQLACGPKTPPAAAAPTAKETPTTLPTPFTVEELQGAMAVGLQLTHAIIKAGAPPLHQIWTVTGANPIGLTMRTELEDLAGAPVSDPYTAEHSWEELRLHAAFPASATTLVLDQQVTVPAGTFQVRRYVMVDPENGSTNTFDFDMSSPGPPVHMTVEVGGATVFEMALVSRAGGADG